MRAALLALAVLLAWPAAARASDDVEGFFNAAAASGQPVEAVGGVSSLHASSAPVSQTPADRGLAAPTLGKAETLSRVEEKAAKAKAAATAQTPPAAAGPVVPADKLRVFSGFSAFPKWHPPLTHGLAAFGKGEEGKTYAIRFKALSGDGMWTWVEDPSNNTFTCRYRAWISKIAGGPTEVSVNPAHNYCQTESNSTGDHIQWTTAPRQKAPIWACPLDEGGEYYFNFQVIDETPNPVNGIVACDEHVEPAGSTQSAVMNQ